MDLLLKIGLVIPDVRRDLEELTSDGPSRAHREHEAKRQNY